MGDVVSVLYLDHQVWVKAASGDFPRIDSLIGGHPTAVFGREIIVGVGRLWHPSLNAFSLWVAQACLALPRPRPFSPISPAARLFVPRLLTESPCPQQYGCAQGASSGEGKGRQGGVDLIQPAKDDGCGQEE